MEPILLRQQAWEMRMRAYAIQIRAKAVTHAARRQQVLARERLECRRLQVAIPEARALTINVIARLLVARNLDAHAPKGVGLGDDAGQCVARRHANAGDLALAAKLREHGGEACSTC